MLNFLFSEETLCTKERRIGLKLMVMEKGGAEPVNMRQTYQQRGLGKMGLNKLSKEERTLYHIVYLQHENKAALELILN